MNFDALSARDEYRLRSRSQPVGTPGARRVRDVGSERVRTGTIVAAELRYAAERSGRWRLAKQVEAVLGAIEIAPFDATAATAYGALRARAGRIGRPIGGNDMLIAAHAIALGDTIVTGNEREFARIEDLPRKNWLRVIH